MFWKLVKYELQSVHKWYLGIYGIAILLSIPLGLMLQKIIFAFEHSHEEPNPLFIAFFALIVFCHYYCMGSHLYSNNSPHCQTLCKNCLWERRLSNQYTPSFCSPINLVETLGSLYFRYHFITRYTPFDWNYSCFLP